MKIIFYAPVLLILALISCNSIHNDKKTFNNSTYVTHVPEWSKHAIWYQIFVERFRNGDTLNDPTINDITGAYPDSIPENWSITPWGQDWYKPDNYFSKTGLHKFQDNLQLRRYGGDLQGVLDQLDYIEDLGINAIYFNPLNDAPSLHKYDPRHWRHIDRNFGPSPQRDMEIIATENPVNPATWEFTAADSLFLKVIEACHKRNIKIILDYSWNHTGMDFWALNDIRKNGKDSKFVDWYSIESFDDKNTSQNELQYKGWYNIKYLPELRKDIIGQDTVFPFRGNLHNKDAKQHIFNVARRWLDPNKDGDPNDGVDGYRLDVAAEIPLGFWPEFRKVVREINSDAFLVGEIWWQAWPDKLMEPQRFLQGDIFDAIMNYRWYRNARWFFADAPTPMPPSEFIDSLKRLAEGINPDNQQAMMNLTASHDAPRTSTSLFNKNLYKYNCKPYDDAAYKIGKPDYATRAIQKMLLMHQFTYIGSPHIWYGDELGMWGADDPDCRKPMVWPDIVYENETHVPINLSKKNDIVSPDTQLLSFYKKLIKIRKSNEALQLGSIDYIYYNDRDQTLAYKRWTENNEVLVVFNKSLQSQIISLPTHNSNNYLDAINLEEIKNTTGNINILLGANSSKILIKE